jgi:hypothetical protein
VIWRRAPGSSAGGSPAIVVVRPWRMCSSPSSASARNACRTVPGFSPWSLARSGTDGSVSPQASCPERIAARTRSAACSHSSRGSAGSGLRSGMLRCSVKGLPVHARLPHRISRAYSVSSSGPRTLRTCVDPRAGLIVRRIYPKSRVGRWGSNPRPADYEKYGPAHHRHYLHGYHEAVPPMAPIALAHRWLGRRTGPRPRRPIPLSCYCT